MNKGDSMVSIISSKVMGYLLTTMATVIALGTVWMYIASLQNNVKEAEGEIAVLKETIRTKELVIVNRDNIITAKEDENKHLLETIDESNRMISIKEADLDRAKTDLRNWEALVANEKFEYINKHVTVEGVDYSKADCEQGLILMKNLSNINYDDL